MIAQKLKNLAELKNLGPAQSSVAAAGGGPQCGTWVVGTDYTE